MKRAVISYLQSCKLTVDTIRLLVHQGNNNNIRRTGIIYLPAAKCKGVLFRPVVSLALTVSAFICRLTLFRSPDLHASNSSRRGSSWSRAYMMGCSGSCRLVGIIMMGTAVRANRAFENQTRLKMLFITRLQRFVSKLFRVGRRMLRTRYVVSVDMLAHAQVDGPSSKTMESVRFVQHRRATGVGYV